MADDPEGRVLRAGSAHDIFGRVVCGSFARVENMAPGGPSDSPGIEQFYLSGRLHEYGSQISESQSMTAAVISTRMTGKLSCFPRHWGVL